MPDDKNIDPWKHKISVLYENERAVEYSVHFYRIHESGWYDEIRYDSHELRKGRDVLAPHFPHEAAGRAQGFSRPMR